MELELIRLEENVKHIFKMDNFNSHLSKQHKYECG